MFVGTGGEFSERPESGEQGSYRLSDHAKALKSLLPARQNRRCSPRLDNKDLVPASYR